jgi:DNA invertase Pin-like site-specific DNA recombinase
VSDRDRKEDRVKVVAYARTSTGGGNGDSLASQEDACREWAAARDHEVVEAFHDAAISGGLPVDERPGLLAAIAEVEEGRAEGLVIHRLDRLARELHVQEVALARLWDAGAHVRVFEAVEGEVRRDDPDDPHRRFLRQVMGAAAELERGLIRARLRRGRERKAARGGYIGGRTVPFGQRVEGGRLVEEPGEQEIIKLIVRLRDEGRTWKQVGEEVGMHPNTVKKVFRRETGRPGGRVHKAAA